MRHFELRGGADLIRRAHFGRFVEPNISLLFFSFFFNMFIDNHIKYLHLQYYKTNKQKNTLTRDINRVQQN